MNDAKELEGLLKEVNTKVQNNVTVVTPETLGQDFFLHISRDANLRKFTPFIGTRQSNMEDRTLPRVTVSPTILGCLIGYAQAEHDFMYLSYAEKDSNGVTWRGGWKIYAVPFKAALKPTARMVYDSRNSDEHWLVTYDADTVHFEPEVAGKMFIRSITYVGRSEKEKLPTADVELYVEVTYKHTLKFGKLHTLPKGCYRITGPAPQNTEGWFSDKEFQVQEISRGEYLSAKNAVADMLGLQEDATKPPAYLYW